MVGTTINYNHAKNNVVVARAEYDPKDDEKIYVLVGTVFCNHSTYDEGDLVETTIRYNKTNDHHETRLETRFPDFWGFVQRK